MKTEDVHGILKEMIQNYYGIEIDVEITDLELNKDGFSNDIAMFHLTYDQSGENFSRNVVLKYFVTETEKKEYTKEITLLRRFSFHKSINVPEVYFEDEEKNLVLMEKVEGVTLDKLYFASPEKFGMAIRKFGETLAHIHSVDINTVQNDISENTSGQDYFELYIENLKSRVSKFDDPKYVQILETISERFKAVKFQETFNHGDYHFLNVIFTNESKLCVLDWEKARIADYRYDLANILILGYSWFGINFKKQVLEAYQNITRKKIEHLECFEALLSFDSFTKVVPLIQGSDDSHIRDRSFSWLARRYELFVEHNGQRMKEAEEFIMSKGISCEKKGLAK